MIINTIIVPQGAEHQAVCRGLQQSNAENVRVIPIPLGTKNVEQILANYSSLINGRVLIMGLCGSLFSAIFCRRWSSYSKLLQFEPQLSKS